MKKRKKVILKAITVIGLMVIFCLVILPFTLVNIYPKVESGQSGQKYPLVDASYIKVYRHESGNTETINFEEYVKGVVAGEMPSSFGMEALKS